MCVRVTKADTDEVQGLGSRAAGRIKRPGQLILDHVFYPMGLFTESKDESSLQSPSKDYSRQAKSHRADS